MATDLWGSLIKSGYRVVYGMQIDGIPYVFGARAMYAMDGTAVAAPSGYTVSHALVIREGMRVSVECDR